MEDNSCNTLNIGCRLVEAIAALHSPLLGRKVDPLTEVIVTHGAYESLGISFMSLVSSECHEKLQLLLTQD